MAYGGNKFISVVPSNGLGKAGKNKKKKPANVSEPTYRAIACNPDGIKYPINPMLPPELMKPWEVTASIKFFLDAQEQLQWQHTLKPAKFLHFEAR